MTTPTRLELHRLKYRQAGGKSSLLSYEELQPEEFQLISSAIFSVASQAQGQRDPWAVMAEVLAGWGVMCPHPVEKRSAFHRGSFLCGACDLPVLVTDRVRKQKTDQARRAP